MTSSMLRRQLKNLVQNFSEAEVKVREATSNDPWGPSSSQMADISDLTYNVVACNEIMTMLWKRLKDDKNWRHVHKSLTLLEYLLKTGDDRVLNKLKDNTYIVKALTEFRFADKDGKDQGVNVREKAKVVLVLMEDDDKLKEERDFAMKTREKTSKNAAASSSDTLKDPSYKPVYVPGATGLPSLDNIPSVADLTASFAARKEEQRRVEAEKREAERRAKLTEEELQWEDAAKAEPKEKAAPGAWGGGAPEEVSPEKPDPWGGTQEPKEASDPWGAPAKPTTATASSDPWGAPTTPPKDMDPFAAPKEESDPFSAPKNGEDPFSAPSSTANNTEDPFAPPKSTSHPFAAPKKGADPFNAPAEDPFNTAKDDPFAAPPSTLKNGEDPFAAPKDKCDPFSAPKEDPFNTAKEDPFNTPKEDPFNTPKEDPFNTPKEDPFNTPKEDPFNTPKEDPFNAPKDPFNTPKEDPFSTPKEDPFNTPKEDPFTTPKEDPFTTPKEDPFNQPKKDPFNSPKDTSDPFSAPSNPSKESAADPFGTLPSPPKGDSPDPFDAAASVPPASEDAWGAPATSPPPPSDDAWGAPCNPPTETKADSRAVDGAMATSPISADPFGDGSKADEDPWDAPVAPPATSDDAWGSPAAPSDSDPSSDPWGDGGSTTTKNTASSDPWGAPSNGTDIKATQGDKVTKLDSFLGAGSALVDMDSLLTFPKLKQNPFSTLPSQKQSMGVFQSPAMTGLMDRTMSIKGVSPTAMSPPPSSYLGSIPVSSYGVTQPPFGLSHSSQGGTLSQMSQTTLSSMPTFGSWMSPPNFGAGVVRPSGTSIPPVPPQVASSYMGTCMEKPTSMWGLPPYSAAGSSPFSSLAGSSPFQPPPFSGVGKVQPEFVGGMPQTAVSHLEGLFTEEGGAPMRPHTLPGPALGETTQKNNNPFLL